jgi:GGDEF domain-containing protein
MISIEESLAELERCDNLRRLTLECYVAGIQNVAHYAIELDDAITGPHRGHLKGLAGEAASGEQSVLLESRATLRGLLREYRDQASKYLNGLREELAHSARALEEIMETMAQGDDDYQEAFRKSIGRLREVAALPEARPVSVAVVSATEAVERQVERIREQSRLLVAEFQAEIRMLHRRIDSLEAAAMVDSMSKLLSRAEMEKRIGGAGDEWFSLLLLRVEGLRLAERQWGESAAAELAGAFGKRLHSGLPSEAVIGRWSHEEFIAKVTLGRAEALAAAKWLTENLSGAYACLKDGKTVRPVLQVAAAVVDREAEESPARMLRRVDEFFER